MLAKSFAHRFGFSRAGIAVSMLMTTSGTVPHWQPRSPHAPVPGHSLAGSRLAPRWASSAAPLVMMVTSRPAAASTGTSRDPRTPAAAGNQDPDNRLPSDLAPRAHQSGQSTYPLREIRLLPGSTSGAKAASEPLQRSSETDSCAASTRPQPQGFQPTSVKTLGCHLTVACATSQPPVLPL